MIKLVTKRQQPLRTALRTAFINVVVVLLVCVGFLRGAKSARLTWDAMSLFLEIDEQFFGSAPSRQDGMDGANMPSMLQLTQSCEDETSACRVPKWMKEYFRWHRETLGNITQPSDWLKQRIFVLRCLDNDGCGGTADRLRPLPYYIAVAARSKRLFFIRWTKPLPLEAILEPFQLNWAMPNTLASLIDQRNGTVVKDRNLVRMGDISLKPGVWAQEGLSQAMTYFQEYNNVVADLENVSSGVSLLQPAEYFHDLFLALFRPVPGLQEMIDRTMHQLNLVPNQFVVTHLRVLYPKHTFEISGDIGVLEPVVWNAVDCASYIFAGAPVYVAADALAAKQVAQEYGRSNRTTVPVVSDLDVVEEDTTNSTNGTLADPLHLDFAQKQDPSAFYNVFADLILMSQSRCVAYSGGGYGRFGSLASFNSSCNAQHGGSSGQIWKCGPTT
jgi:hypothetical protein